MCKSNVNVNARELSRMSRVESSKSRGGGLATTSHAVKSNLLTFHSQAASRLDKPRLPGGHENAARASPCAGELAPRGTRPGQHHLPLGLGHAMMLGTCAMCTCTSLLAAVAQTPQSRPILQTRPPSPIRHQALNTIRLEYHPYVHKSYFSAIYKSRSDVPNASL